MDRSASDKDVVRVPDQLAPYYQEQGTEFHYPKTVKLPIGRTRPTVLRAQSRLGLDIKGTVEYIIDTMRKILIEYGYVTKDGTTYTRDKDLVVVIQPYDYLPQRISVRERPRAFAAKYRISRLPDYTESTFKEFLEINGYVRVGDEYVREEPLLIHETRYEDLFTPDEYKNIEPVVIEDLLEYNIDYRSFYNQVRYDYQYRTLGDLVAIYSKKLDIPPAVLRLVLLAIMSPNASSLASKVRFVPIKYTERTDPLPPVPKNMLLREAVRRGYQLSSYVDTIKEKYDTTETSARIFVEMVEKYPDAYDKIAGLDSLMWSIEIDDRNFAKVLARLMYPDGVVDPLQYVYAFAFNAPFPRKYSSKALKRKQRIDKISISRRHDLYRLYRVSSTIQVLEKPVHPLEEYIFFFGREIKSDKKCRAAAEMLGMYVPEDVDSVYDYITWRLLAYANVLARPQVPPPLHDLVLTKRPLTIEDLDVYTDYELLDFFGARDTLRDYDRPTYIRVVLSPEPTFMVFSQLDTQRCTNTETTLLTQVTDLPPPYLVYGDYLSFRVLEIEELLQAFYRVGDEYVYTKIGEVGKEYTMTEILALTRALREIQRQDRARVYGQYISELMGRLFVYGQEIRRAVRVLKSVQDKEAYIHYLWLVFYAGMYMRRWLGPGHPYPHEAKDTLINMDPTPNITMALNDIADASGPITIDIPVLDRYDDRVHVTEYTLGPFLQNVREERFCIREAGTMLITTAAYFLENAFGVEVPGLELHRLARIS